ncbi:hypothetical protein [Desulfoluna sp.]|uniref:hypothetical protein n=1 Tax=Desulfoluna sp. TaxID=2045199 RepID=UPI002632811E|nr:hypothetical protein [Desulfoluna sp.]
MSTPASDLTTTALMGSVTAPATHDLMNVLAIINEHAGLLSDLLQFGGPEALTPEHLEKGIAAIATQVTRGRTLLTHLNRLAHAPDPNPSPVDVGLVTEEIVALTQRRFHARLAAPASSGIVTCDPVRVRLLIFRLLEAACHPTQQEETLVTVTSQGATLDITLEGHRPLEHPDPLAEEIGALLTSHHHTHTLSLKITD